MAAADARASRSYEENLEKRVVSNLKSALESKHTMEMEGKAREAARDAIRKKIRAEELSVYKQRLDAEVQ